MEGAQDSAKWKPRPPVIAAVRTISGPRRPPLMRYRRFLLPPASHFASPDSRHADTLHDGISPLNIPGRGKVSLATNRSLLPNTGISLPARGKFPATVLKLRF
ncbi:Hypothetical protein NTJ_02888 [Nesidiocoris tenuis]|uniref:Uncharacterized protein n=1 Tax=Nesidiocoris tenuis TaxID=355587 RepID=A0ABN7ACS2_9HEMI|nr:Hypothetical protein NTJ_02888 [Nesidiocoris tenuis]